MFIDQGHKTSKVLRFTRVSSSTWYKRRKTQVKDCKKVKPIGGRPVSQESPIAGKGNVGNEKVINFLKEIRSREFFDQLGYRKLHPFLERDYGVQINHKKLYRLYKRAGLALPIKKKNKRRGKKICMNRKVTGTNQLWQFDIKYGFIDGENRFFYLMAFIDVFSREVVHYHVGLSCKASDILFALGVALNSSGAKTEELVIRSDNGPQMTSRQFEKEVKEFGVEHEFTPPSSPNLNAYIESFFSIIDRELYQQRYFMSYKEAYEEVIKFIKHYNEIRPHSSLKMMAPKQFTESMKIDKNQVELAA